MATRRRVTGLPAITAPGTLEGGRGKAAVQQLSNNIRERFEKIEGPLNELLLVSDPTDTTAQVKDLIAQVALLRSQVTALSQQVAALKLIIKSGDASTLVLMELEGEDGEDGFTIPGPPGPPGEPGAIIMIEGDPDDDDFYPPPA